MRRRLLVSLALAGLTAAAAAQPAREASREREALREAERARAAQIAAQHLAAGHARAAQEQEHRLADARVATAARLQAVEADAAAAAVRLDALTRRRAEAERRLTERAEALAPVLPLAQRLARYPAETLLAAPAAPEAALRGLFVLRALTRRLEQDAAALRAERAEVQALADAAAAETARLRQVQAVQAAQAAALDRQIAAARQRRDDSEDQAEAATRRAAADAARAETLRAAIERLQAESLQTERLHAERRQMAAARARDAREEDARAGRRHRGAEAAVAEPQHASARAAPPAAPPGPGPGPGAAIARAGPVPVAGRVVRAWGERTEVGPANGVSYQAAPAARVVAPCGGRVVFAGPFRSFGPMVILECGGGHHFVLAGLDRLDVQVGRAVRAGEPVGVMPGWEPGTRDGERPTLYVELRRDGRPVNPALFLRARG